MRLKKVLAAAIILSLPAAFNPTQSLAGTTGKIVGKVTEAKTQAPLPGASVLLAGTTLGAATDLAGDYFIINVPPGNYSLTASMIGYKSLTKTGVTVSVDRTTRVDFRIEETVIEMGETVTVLAERPLVERDETSTRHFVQAQEIAARPASQLTQILTTLPGIDNVGGELTVRRGTLDQVAFIIDGMRARNPLDFQPYTGINLSAIRELEVITGGFNAEYGEAQSGVFNIITKEGSPRLEGYSELRWTPPGKHHWGTALYDYSTTRYWENTHARHLQWWIDHPDQWVDPNGVAGNDPRANWTPEQAYEDYMRTHQPLTDYTERSGLQGELSLGGPLPVRNLFFFVSGRYRTAPPITGNSYRKMGSWIDATAKVTFQLRPNMKLMFSSFAGSANTNWGMEAMGPGWVSLENKYAYVDYPGYPKYRINGQTLKLTHTLSKNSFYEAYLSRSFTYRSQSTFPNDEAGWETGAPQTDRLRAVDENGNAIPGGNSNLIGLHTTGYYYRGRDRDADLTFSGDYISQLNKNWQIKSGGDFTYYSLNRFQEARTYSVIERAVYHPYEGNLYFQNKLEFEGLIMNLGLRYDFYNPNDVVYLDPFDPFDLVAAARENREPNPKTEPTKISGQLSPRLGISHPISEKAVLHFSYGHFFQRATFGNYGEGYGGEGGEVTGILNTYLTYPAFGDSLPYNLGNRKLKPQKAVAYEVGIERNFGGLVTDVTAFYKDYRNSVRTVQVFMADGTSYLTTGNSDYADAKGLELQVRKPLAGYWGGYLNYTWTTGIFGRSGDPDVIAAPGSDIQTGIDPTKGIGDAILYDPPRLKFGFTLATPEKFSPLRGLLSKIELALDYQVYYPHKQIASHNFVEGGKAFIRPADKNADLRLRKELDIKPLLPTVFVEIRNVFNDKWVDLQTVSDAQPEDKARFINSGFEVFPEKSPNGGPFPDVLQYRNLPRMVIFGAAIRF